MKIIDPVGQWSKQRGKDQRDDKVNRNIRKIPAYDQKDRNE
jgi:hypothetical protein